MPSGRGHRVVLDVLPLLVANTGIRSYILLLHQGLHKDHQIEYVTVPNFDWVQKVVFFLGKLPFWKRSLWHLIHLVWYSVILPSVILFTRANVLICPNYIAPSHLPGARKVIVLHDAFLWDRPNDFSSWWRRYYLRLLYWGVSGNTQLITTSIYTKERLREHFKDIPIKVIYQSGSVIPTKGSLKEKNDRAPVFLHVGYFDRRKNLPVLVRAYALFLQQNPESNIPLALVGGRRGDGDDDWVFVTNLIKQLNLQKHVLLPGYVNQAELSAWYSRALLYIFPSLDEGFGIPLVDAMNNGLPIIISNKGALREIAGDAALSFDASSEADLADKLTLLYRNSDLRQELSLRTRERAVMFSPEGFARQWLNLLC